MDSDVKFTCRVAKLNDLEIINQYWWCLIGEQKPFDNRLIDSEVNRHRSMNFLREKITQGSLYVAELNYGEILGLGSVTRDLHFLQTKLDVWNIADIWVRPEFRRMKIASKIVNLLEKVAYDNGAEEIRLTVYSKNMPANKLYYDQDYNPLITTYSKSIPSDISMK